MQRSRRALLQRRAALKNSVLGGSHLYKVSLSLILLLWGLIFLLSPLISHGNSHQDELGVVGKLSLSEIEQEQNKGFRPQEQNKGFHSQSTLNLRETSSDNGNEGIHHLKDDTIGESERLIGEKIELKPAGQEKVPEDISNPEAKPEKEAPLKSDRLSRIGAPGLDEFKSKTITAKGKPITGQAGSVIHRVEPTGREYNYASATKGAKVLAFNKEAKGASNILGKDKDKYLRNPCSAEEKFVIIELSEETLVDAIEIANFEHYSSNLKDFELLSSLIYPTDTWVKLGNFTAANVKQAQRFALQEPKWARYLRLNLVSHYGSEFYCTVSILEVYGVDAVERMLEDLISVQDARVGPEEPRSDVQSSTDPTYGDDLHPEPLTESDCDQCDSGREILTSRNDILKGNGVDRVVETRPTQGGRMPGDTVLKILMQKVQQLDVNFSVLERYLEELNSRYGQIFKDFDNEITNNELLLKHIREETKNLQNSKDGLTKDIAELLSWKLFVSLQLDKLVKDNIVLRSQVEKIHNDHAGTGNKILAVVFTSFLFVCFAAFTLLTDLLLSICRLHKSEKFCGLSSAWFFLLLSNSIVALILVS